LADAGVWPWLALAGLGAFHGLNPAMGWLFAVALGLHKGSRRVVLIALVPIALGHALAVLVVVLAVMAFGTLLDPVVVRRGCGLLLIGWATWHAWYGRRHRVRFGMTTGLAGLGAWSFLMAMAHGAGLMLIPLLAPIGAMPGMGDMPGHHAMVVDALLPALAAVAIHSLAMLATTAVIAVLVYDWIGVGVLRRGWVNLDLLWTGALVFVGVWLLV
jgi:hypothetical protein